MEININELLEEVKCEAKLVVIEAEGVKFCDAIIGFQSILKKFAGPNAVFVPDEAGYKLFDFDSMEEYIERIYPANTQEKLRELKQQEEEFLKIKNLLNILHDSLTNFRR